MHHKPASDAIKCTTALYGLILWKLSKWKIAWFQHRLKKTFLKWNIGPLHDYPQRERESVPQSLNSDFVYLIDCVSVCKQIF